MGLLISISYNNQPVTYDVTLHQEEVYLLRLAQSQEAGNENYLPEKMMIRKKGKIWVSDLENYSELVGKLTDEISNFNSKKLSA
ncbi:MAG TPA: hypothetical protein VNT20_17155 [Flavisolibacter sp.]|jgi:hypothetical protein|nr:hypothetical protein [Flavisolibacter sp.]